MIMEIPRKSQCFQRIQLMEGVYFEYITCDILYASALDISVYQALIPGLDMSSNLCHLFFMNGQGKLNLHYTLK